ncbi:uncharacterized protein LOC130015263 [Mercurialis annua]|uniref:uncharacterized protein LOC130015263 n=1 Tax=Mercurialis annua TaxID=3986 RepID=UPI0024ADA444|nr:uncharacterized protein LOC130015263 [Mercurialis annua]
MTDNEYNSSGNEGDDPNSRPLRRRGQETSSPEDWTPKFGVPSSGEDVKRNVPAEGTPNVRMKGDCPPSRVHLEDYGGDRIDYSDWFKSGHGFDTDVETITWAKSTAIWIGFELVISSHKNEGKKKLLRCARGERYRGKTAWFILTDPGISSTHNHALAVYPKGYRQMSGLSGEAKEIVRDMSAAQAKPCSIMAALKEKVPSDNPTIRQVYNYRETLRKSSFEGRDVVAQFYHMAQKNDYVHWTLAKEDTGVVTHIFMAHPDSVRLLRSYYWIIDMDSTYKTNKYKLPFF